MERPWTNFGTVVGLVLFQLVTILCGRAAEAAGTSGGPSSASSIPYPVNCKPGQVCATELANGSIFVGGVMDIDEFAKYGSIEELFKGKIPLQIEHNGQIYSTTTTSQQQQQQPQTQRIDGTATTTYAGGQGYHQQPSAAAHYPYNQPYSSYQWSSPPSPTSTYHQTPNHQSAQQSNYQQPPAPYHHYANNHYANNNYGSSAHNGAPAASTQQQQQPYQPTMSQQQPYSPQTSSSNYNQNQQPYATAAVHYPSQSAPTDSSNYNSINGYSLFQNPYTSSGYQYGSAPSQKQQPGIGEQQSIDLNSLILQSLSGNNQASTKKSNNNQYQQQQTLAGGEATLDLNSLLNHFASNIKIEGASIGEQPQLQAAQATEPPATAGTSESNSNFIDLSHLLKNGLQNGLQLEMGNGGFSINLGNLFAGAPSSSTSADNGKANKVNSTVTTITTTAALGATPQVLPYPYHAYFGADGVTAASAGIADKSSTSTGKVVNVNIPSDLLKGDLLDDLGNIRHLSFGAMAKALVRRAIKSMVYRVFPSVRSLKGVAERGCKDVQSIGSLDSVLMPLGLAVTLHPLLMPLVPFLLLTLGTIKAIESATCFVSDFF